ncbi:hypothetical protein A3F00_01105 [Candidatus Daviesbacteria bacterium RIFCSPHIGHO2_12_FULL_37_11]|uniref:tRNA dimethylallyltransferase n=1 Tax=Candidatus Daviesbacteria bacterium RIFCSPHIGHO2_12_FULL_37_11 TaxID=1797777 RepID=A0A1F5K946_9BACT|nr:MAG: hypothetical protein A3F00_01105 [Candidatus Daviesbacteria bacterium RIFCSPHIGHO2_12_FULL_37_11]
MNKLLVILGPTATGKTDLALQLASKFQGELVACDSRQVYRGLDIGTGKMPTHSVILRAKPEGYNYILRFAQNDIEKSNGYWIVDGVKIWMYDVVSLKVQYTVADYVKDAEKVIMDIWNREKLPIIVGGTGLYLKALLEGLPNLEIPVDMDLREKLEKLSVEELQEKLKGLSIKKWKGLNESDRQNPRRLVRAAELTLDRGDRGNKGNQGIGTGIRNCDILKIGLTAPREVLYEQTDLRVLEWIDQGIIEETKELHKKGLSLKRMRQLGLEYGVLADYLEGKLIDGNMQNQQSLLARRLASKIHGYIRRQLTWFKKEKNVEWFDVTKQDYVNNVEILVGTWYHNLK